jgi:hypothetical protein
MITTMIASLGRKYTKKNLLEKHCANALSQYEVALAAQIQLSAND